MSSRTRAIALAVCAFAVAAIAAPSSNAATRDVVVVGNAFGGTVSFLDGNTYSSLGSINIAPDLATRKFLIRLNPINLIGWEVVKGQKGGENYVDDVALSNDGKKLYVSRGILQDVAAFDIKTKKMLWRTDMGTFNSDHMAITPDGTRLFVSATTSGKTKAVNTSTGKIIGEIDAGDYPHGVDISEDGKRVYIGSIGTTSLPYSLNSLKGNKQLTIADANTYKVIKSFKYDYGVRPTFISPGEQTAFFQRSYYRGFVEVSLATGAILRTKSDLPATSAGDALYPDKLPANSMHHGLSLSGDGTRICNAGTIDNYVSIVDRASFGTLSTVGGLSKPYWSQTSLDGNSCLVSNSTGNYVSVISYATGLETKRVAVGNYPQRERLGKLDTTVVSSLSSSAG
ncbi:MAG: YncE family protein [Thermoleophilaceae bacterium]|nr:YncE family protein [Thermoleophilaceae bacterium]